MDTVQHQNKLKFYTYFYKARIYSDYAEGYKVKEGIETFAYPLKDTRNLENLKSLIVVSLNSQIEEDEWVCTDNIEIHTLNLLQITEEEL